MFCDMSCGNNFILNIVKIYLVLETYPQLSANVIEGQLSYQLNWYLISESLYKHGLAMSKQYNAYDPFFIANLKTSCLYVAISLLRLRRHRYIGQFEGHMQ